VPPLPAALWPASRGRAFLLLVIEQSLLGLSLGPEDSLGLPVVAC
jgi:hypothetical protein